MCYVLLAMLLIAFCLLLLKFVTIATLNDIRIIIYYYHPHHMDSVELYLLDEENSLYSHYSLHLGL